MMMYLLLFVFNLFIILFYFQYSYQATNASEVNLSRQSPQSRKLRHHRQRQLLGKNARVVNGLVYSESFETNPKYVVSLLNRRSQHTCGGILISPNIIVTAAHCKRSIRAVYISRDGGIYQNKNKLQDSDHIIPIEEKHKLLHPKYSRKYLSYDIMLIKLPVQVNEFPWRVESFPRLHHSSMTIPSQKESLMVMGWGLTSTDGSASPVLLTARLDYVNSRECKGIYGSTSIDESMLCAHSSQGRDACQGDSGGPLVMFDGDKTTLLGVVSWGHDCAHPKYPGVYSRISASLEWIIQNVCSKLSPESCTEDGSNIKPVFITPTFAPSSSPTESSHNPSQTPTSVMINLSQSPKTISLDEYFANKKPILPPSIGIGLDNFDFKSINNPSPSMSSPSPRPTKYPIPSSTGIGLENLNVVSLNKPSSLMSSSLPESFEKPPIKPPGIVLDSIVSIPTNHPGTMSSTSLQSTSNSNPNIDLILPKRITPTPNPSPLAGSEDTSTTYQSGSVIQPRPPGLSEKGKVALDSFFDIKKPPGINSNIERGSVNVYSTEQQNQYNANERLEPPLSSPNDTKIELEASSERFSLSSIVFEDP